MVSASTKVQHVMSRRSGTCKAEAEPRKPIARFFYAAFLSVCIGNVSVTLVVLIFLMRNLA